jgi:hypothetical protein
MVIVLIMLQKALLVSLYMTADPDLDDIVIVESVSVVMLKRTTGPKDSVLSLTV